MSTTNLGNLEARAINFCNGAPRTWAEIVSCLAGVSDATRTDLPVEDEAWVTEVSYTLGEMVRAGKMTRTYAADPRLDRFCPVSRPEPVWL